LLKPTASHSYTEPTV